MYGQLYLMPLSFSNMACVESGLRPEPLPFVHKHCGGPQ
jgi:hypothetical protein